MTPFQASLYASLLKQIEDQQFWTTADALKIPVRELGDQHIVHILEMMEQRSYHLPRDRYRFYRTIVREALRRRLFTWSVSRKYIPAIAQQLDQKAKWS